MRILVLGLGNDLIADDAAGPIAVRRMREAWQASDDAPTSARVEFVESSVSGVALLDDLVGYDRALILDAVATGRAPPGTIHELRPEDLGAVVAPSPHYAGLPEMLTLAEEMALDFPAEVSILGLEVVDPHTIGGPLSEEVIAALPALVETGLARIHAWLAAG